MLTEEEFRDLNNEVVVPAYRQFCRENGLDFHFWDELPEDQFNLKMAKGELELQREALSLFNQLKPPFHFFRNQIVSFQFTSWGGDFDYQAEPMEKFLTNHSELVELLAKTERRYRQLCAALATIGVLSIAWAVFRFLPPWLLNELGLIAVGFCLIAAWVVAKSSLHEVRNSRARRRAQELQMRLERLRTQLQTVQAQVE